MATETTPLSTVTPTISKQSAHSRWKALLPSMPDFMFVALLGWLFAAGPFGWVGLLSDGDTGWHIRTGEYILDNLRVPAVDLFSFSKPGEPWFAWEWGADVIFAALFRFAGLKALVLVCGALICLMITLVFVRTVRAGSNFFVALLLTGL